jgi:hypothetical protein
VTAQRSESDGTCVAGYGSVMLKNVDPARWFSYSARIQAFEREVDETRSSSMRPAK